MVSSNYSFFPEHHLVHNTSLFPRFPINFPPFRASLPLQLTKDKKALFLRLPTRNKSPSSRFLRAPLPLICPPLCALPTPRCADFHPPLSARIAPTSTPSTFPLAGGLRIPFTATPTPGRCRPLSSPGASPYPRPAAGDHRRARAHTFLSHASPTLPPLGKLSCWLCSLFLKHDKQVVFLFALMVLSTKRGSVGLSDRCFCLMRFLLYCIGFPEKKL